MFKLKVQLHGFLKWIMNVSLGKFPFEDLNLGKFLDTR